MEWAIIYVNGDPTNEIWSPSISLNGVNGVNLSPYTIVPFVDARSVIINSTDHNYANLLADRHFAGYFCPVSFSMFASCCTSPVCYKLINAFQAQLTISFAWFAFHSKIFGSSFRVSVLQSRSSILWSLLLWVNLPLLFLWCKKYYYMYDINFYSYVNTKFTCITACWLEHPLCRRT